MLLHSRCADYLFQMANAGVAANARLMKEKFMKVIPKLASVTVHTKYSFDRIKTANNVITSDFQKGASSKGSVRHIQRGR